MRVLILDPTNPDLKATEYVFELRYTLVELVDCFKLTRKGVDKCWIAKNVFNLRDDGVKARRKIKVPQEAIDKALELFRNELIYLKD